MVVAAICRTLTRVAAAIAVTVAAAGAQADTAELDQPAPELNIKLLNGKTLKAKNLRGKVIVNVIWATWSPAARMELPNVQKIYQNHRDTGLEIVALAIDENTGDVRNFWRERSYSFPVGMRSDAFFDHYGRVSTTPTFYIIDRQGVLRHRINGALGYEKLESLLKPLLTEAVKPKSAATQ